MVSAGDNLLRVLEKKQKPAPSSLPGVVANSRLNSVALISLMYLLGGTVDRNDLYEAD